MKYVWVVEHEYRGSNGARENDVLGVYASEARAREYVMELATELADRHESKHGYESGDVTIHEQIFSLHYGWAHVFLEGEWVDEVSWERFEVES